MKTRWIILISAILIFLSFFTGLSLISFQDPEIIEVERTIEIEKIVELESPQCKMDEYNLDITKKAIKLNEQKIKIMASILGDLEYHLAHPHLIAEKTGRIKEINGQLNELYNQIQFDETS